MAGFGHSGRGTRDNPVDRIDPDTLGIIGIICAVAGFFTFGILLGPVAMVAGWFAMGRRWTGSRHVAALVAVVLGALDLLLSLVALAGAGRTGLL